MLVYFLYKFSHALHCLTSQNVKFQIFFLWTDKVPDNSYTPVVLPAHQSKPAFHLNIKGSLNDVNNAHFNGNRWQIVLQYVAKLAGIPRYSTDSTSHGKY